ncbi:hypothetical protein [Streptomyces sp. AS02]|uniref:hypothetical protein n=1 Tax=Streptomyces sp. AS02 TaxID=2938946 RepID=UPI002020F88B|nr:hypothetical protein [Streptomyces sp. AS02]MCL8011772.1 hypothetical protein [Streptomyces sp. AS02]
MAAGKEGGRASRVRIWVGILAVGTGALLAGDPAHRAHATLEWAARWWPWALLALASVNLLRSAVPAGSLIGPLFLGAVGLFGLIVSHGLDERLARDLLAPVLLAMAGAALVLSGAHCGRRTSWTRLLATGDVVVPAGTVPPLTVRAVLGELRADLRQLEDDVEVNVTAIAGHVRLTVPRTGEVRVHTPGALLTKVALPESPPEELPRHEGEFTVHVLGLCGSVSISRA